MTKKAASLLRRSLRVEWDDDVAETLRAIQTESSDPLEDVFPRALRGEWAAVRLVCSGWVGFVDELAAAVTELKTAPIRRSGDQFAVHLTANHWSAEPLIQVHRMVADAPFQPWVGRYGWDLGTKVFAVDTFRFLMPGCVRVHAHARGGWPELPEHTDVPRFRRLVELALRSMLPPLVQVAEMFEFSDTELGAIFGVSRQAVSQWQTGEVPTSRMGKLSNILAVGELIERKLKPGMLPVVARRSAAQYGGRTMVEMMELGRDEELRELTEQTFDWSATA